MMHVKLMEVSLIAEKKDISILEHTVDFLIYDITTKKNKLKFGNEKIDLFYYVGKNLNDKEQYFCGKPLLVKIPVKDFIIFSEKNEIIGFNNFFKELSDEMLKKHTDLDMQYLNEVSELIKLYSIVEPQQDVLCFNKLKQEIKVEKDYNIFYVQERESLSRKLEIILNIIKEEVIKLQQNEFK